MHEIKTCNTCKKQLFLECFHKKKNSKDGHSPQCKKCRKKYLEKFKDKYNLKRKNDRKENLEEYREKDRENYEKNKEQKLAWCKKYREKHPDEIKRKKRIYYEKNKERIIEKSKKYYEENKDESLAKMKTYYENNKEEILEYHKKYQSENKDKISDYRNKNKEKISFLRKKHHDKRRSLGKILDCKLTENDISSIVLRFNNKCFKCSSTEDLCFDHHFPLSDGCGISLGNAVVLCRSCNSIKKNKPPDKFYTESELGKLHTLGIAKEKKELTSD